MMQKKLKQKLKKGYPIPTKIVESSNKNDDSAKKKQKLEIGDALPTKTKKSPTRERKKKIG